MTKVAEASGKGKHTRMSAGAKRSWGAAMQSHPFFRQHGDHDNHGHRDTSGGPVKNNSARAAAPSAAGSGGMDQADMQAILQSYHSLALAHYRYDSRRALMMK